MPKILFVCYDLKDGGSPHVLSSILNHLHRDIFEPVLVTFSDARVYPIPDDIQEHVLHVKAGGNLIRKLVSNLTAAVRLRRILQREMPEIALGMGGITNWTLILAARLAHAKTAIIIGEHGAGALKHRKDRVTSKLIGLLNRFLYPLADRVVAISDGVREYLEQDLKLPETKIVSITNPVEIERIRRLSRAEINHPWLVHKDKPVILWVGRIEVLKGVQYIIGAFERVLREIDARLVIVGEGSDQGRIENIVMQKGLKEKVDFAGYQKNPYRFMPRSDVLAFPSLGGEAFGLVLTEAMACDLPVIATDCVAGPREVLQNGKCGLLVPVGDEESLAKGIVRILTDPELRDQLVTAGARRVMDFESAQVVTSYEQLFREMGNAKNSAGPVADSG